MILNRRLLQEHLLENSVASDGLPGYQATWLPIVSQCVEKATYGLPIVGSSLELNDNSCLKKNCLVDHNLKALNSDLIYQIEVMNELKMYWAETKIHDWCLEY